MTVRLAARSFMALLFPLVFGLSPQPAEAQAPEQAPPREPADPPVNRWQRLLREKTGHRLQPVFCYLPGIRKFLLTTGLYKRARHFDTEHFDLETRAWSNAYPPGAPYRKASGPTDAPPYTAKSGKQPFLTRDKNNVTRVRFDYGIKPWANESFAFGQWALNTKSGNLYTHLFGRCTTCSSSWTRTRSTCGSFGLKKRVSKGIQ
jgi:hypothetical protein